MPPHDPSDDFSQLPTADGAVPERKAPTDRLRQASVRRPQTRIGPRSPAPEEQPSPEPSALSDDWNELIQSTEINESLETKWLEEIPPPEPQIKLAPRRTVIGKRETIPEEIETKVPESQIEPLCRPAINGPIHKTEPEPESAISNKPPQEKRVDPTSGDASKTKPKSAEKKPVLKVSEKPVLSEKTPEDSEKKNTPPAGPWHERWERWGGKALSLSVAIHAIFILGGAAVVVTQVMEPKVDFLPGGGTKQGNAASQALEHQIQQKKSPWLKKAMPMRKIAAAGALSEIVLPDEMPDLLDLPQASNLLGGKMTAGLGMGLAGAGGGAGKSMGLGSKSGMVFQPISMFGMQIKSKKLALVLDVSTSMAPHLPRVIEEVDKVARGSVVILYFGCGLEPPPPGGIEGDDVFSTSSVEFEKFWRLGGATLDETRKFRIDPKKEIQSESIYRMLSKRPQTYFIHNTGLGYTWLALLSDQVRTADGIYWFSDFQDRVDFKQVTIVRENMERRKQRLYMHAYFRGSSFDLVRTQLMEPTGGDVKIEE